MLDFATNMSNRMEVDSPSTPRDPRLASRNQRTAHSRRNFQDGGSSQGVTNAQQPASARPSDLQNGSGSDQFVLSISSLIQAAVVNSKNQAEKERCQKRKEAMDGMLKKCKSQSSNFPSTASFFQQTTKDEDMELARVENNIQKNGSNYRQLETNIKKWSLPDSSKFEEKIKTLEAEIRTLKNEAATSGNQNRATTAMSKETRDRVSLLERSVTNHTSTLNAQARHNKENEDHFKSFGDGMIVFSKRLDGFNSQLSVLEKKKLGPPSFGSEIQTLGKNLDGFDNQLANLEKQEAAPQNAEVMRTFNDLTLRLKTLEAAFAGYKAPPSQPSPDLREKLDRIDQELENLIKVQMMKDDIMFGETEKIQKAFEDHDGKYEALSHQVKVMSGETKSIQTDHGRVLEELKGLREKSQSAALNQVSAVSLSLQSTQRILESVRVGLHSLETRYNNLSTEPIVKHMVAAFNEMYPSAQQMTDQINTLKRQMGENSTAQKTYMRQTNQEIAAQLEGLNRLRNDHTSLSNSLGDLLGQNRESQAQGLQQLQVNLMNLHNRVEETTARLEERFNSKDSSEEALKKALNQERETLANNLKNLTQNLNDLANKYATVKSANLDTADAAKEQESNAQSLLTRINRLEQSTSKNYQSILEKLREEPEESPVKSPQPKQEESVASEETAADQTMASVAESNPTEALRKKKKRPRVESNVSEDERSTPRVSSPRVSSPMSTPGPEGSSSIEKKKKKKKRKVHSETITLDD